MRQRVQYVVMVIILTLAILAQPVALIARQGVTVGENSIKERSFGQQSLAGTSDIFLPIMMTPPGPPAFVINSPNEGGTISGMIFFAAQVTDARTVSSVTFQAGTTVLGTDNTPEDGYRVFLDASSFPVGQLQLTATATGQSGETSKSIMVNVVPNPPSSGTIGANGDVLASEIGSIITFPPAAVPNGTFVSVTEKSQEDVTAETGIEWEDIGVTFLGAQDIQASVTISKPLTVASAGFGNRVQPGQAVVNYRIIPDADGDGVDEIVVVNTASVAPNNDVISDPVSQIVLKNEELLVGPDYNQRINGTDEINGSSGQYLEFEVTGFNPYSLNGNVAIFRSTVDNSESGFAGQIRLDPNDPTKQFFRTAIPYFSEGEATLIFRNESTGATTEEINITINPLPNLDSPTNEVYDEYYSQFTLTLQELLMEIGSDPDLSKSLSEYTYYLDESIEELQSAQTSMQEAFDLLANDPEPEVESFLDDGAKMIESSGILDNPLELRFLANPNTDPGCTPPVLDKSGLAQDFIGFMPFGTLIFGGGVDPIEAAGQAATVAGRPSVGTALGAVDTGTTAASIQTRLFNNILDGFEYAENVREGKCDDNPPPSPNPNPIGHRF